MTWSAWCVAPWSPLSYRCGWLTVADDGAGFDPELITSGYGLRGMRDRIAQVGGTIQVTSAPGRGTQVCAEVPG
jgi:signal transduction histidine kinase